VVRAAAAILQDILDAASAIQIYTRDGREVFAAEAMVRDAVVARLIQIGQAVKDAQSAGIKLHALRPDIPWQRIAGMRDRLAHRYWETEPNLVWAVVETELPKLVAAVQEMTQTAREPGMARRRKQRAKPGRGAD
jgi:uncharacterized protein with HEPN domain